MRAIFSIILTLLLTSLQTIAQNDTTYTYLDSCDRICARDTAVFVKIFYKNDDIWHLEKYASKTRYILEETMFSEDSGSIKNVIELKEFKYEGILYKRLIFVRGVKTRGLYYYNNGAIKGTADFNRLGEIIKQSGFDENGGEIRNYYFEKEPELVGDASLWNKHVYRNLNIKQLYQNKAPMGSYKIQLCFYVNIDGTISDITVDKDFGYGIKEEAIRLLKSVGKWNAGIVDGRKVRQATCLTLAFKLDEQLPSN